MGYYINPHNETKEEFLGRVGTLVPVAPTWAEIPTDSNLVILLHNRSFTAAAILFDEKEFNEFMDPDDTRRREYYYVHKTEVDCFL
jgi:hypothetical protein